MTPDELAAIEARANAAMDGPWYTVYSEYADDVSIRMEEPDGSRLRGSYVEIAESSQCVDDHSPTAEFIAHSRTDVVDLIAAVRERDATIARVRDLHVRDQDGDWTCNEDDCEDCLNGNGHQGPVCDYCTTYGVDDPECPSIVVWPCPTVQIIDGLPAPGLRALTPPEAPTLPPFRIGDRVRKTRGSSWQGTVCGHYSTRLTPTGVCVESEREPGSVQIYPVTALEAVPE